jgi:hypothetical protein
VCRIDGSELIGRVRQSFAETTTFAGARQPYSSSQAVPVFAVQVGVRWQGWRGGDLFLGYQYEHWWNAGRLGRIDTMGELYDQGIILRSTFCF